jgi:hypothetical protein
MDLASSFLNQAAPTRSTSAQDVLAHASTTNAPSELVAPKRITSAPSELVAPECTISDPAANGATDKVAIDVDGDDSPLSPAFPEVVPLPRWDVDLGRSYRLNHNLMHKFILIVLTISLTRIGAYHELYGGSRDNGAPASLGLAMRFWLISSPT